MWAVKSNSIVKALHVAVKRFFWGGGRFSGNRQTSGAINYIENWLHSEVQVSTRLNIVYVIRVVTSLGFVPHKHPLILIELCSQTYFVAGPATEEMSNACHGVGWFSVFFCIFLPLVSPG